jgi:hypothetical protein
VAERVSLAEFTVDTNGLVTGLKFADQQTAQTARKMGISLDGVTAKMFSVRSAALKLAGAFGFAGVTYAAANAVASLTKDLIGSTTWFHNAADAVMDWYGELAHGEDTIDRLSRKIQNLETMGALKRLRELVEARKQLQAEAGKVAMEPITPSGGLRRRSMSGAGAPIPDVSPGTASALKAIEISMQGVNREINGIIQTLARQGLSLGDIERLSGATLQFNTGVDIAAENEAAANSLKHVAEGAGAVKTALEDLSRLSVQGENPLQRLDIEQEKIDRFARMAALVEQIRLGFMALGHEGAKPIKEATDAIEHGLTMAEAKFQAFEGALSSTISSIGTAFAEGDLSGKRFLASLMQSVGQACFALSAMFAAAAIAASTGIGAAVVQGTPAQLGAAAAGFFAAGVAATAIGGSAGRGHSTGSHGRGGGFGSPALAGAGGGGPNVTVVIHGSVMGMTKNELARELKTLIERAEEDGA